MVECREGWITVGEDTRAGGNKAFGSTQTNASNHGNAQGGSKDKVADTGGRIYRMGTQNGKGLGPLQTTLSELWKGNTIGTPTCSWSEDIAWREQESQKDRQQSTLSYV